MITAVQSWTGHEVPAFVDPLGIIRLLTRTTESVLPQQFKAQPFADAPGVPVIDLASIPTYDRWQANIPILDQGQIGCHRSDTEILTEHGWKLWGDYDRKSLVGTMNPLTGMLEFQLPSAFHAYEYDGPLFYTNRTDGSLDFALTPNHRMMVRKWNQRERTLEDNYRFTEIGQVGWYSGLPHATSGYNGIQLDHITVDDNVSISGDDFVALVAVVISDGWVGSTESNKGRVGFCCFRDDRREMVAALAHRLGFTEQESRKGAWYQRNPSLAEWFKTNAYDGIHQSSPHKIVPGIIKTLGTRQVQHFLKFFGDQHIDKNNKRQFYSSSHRMIDDLQELLLRIGVRGSIYERDPRSTKMSDGREINAENCKADITLSERTTDRLSLERKKELVTDRYKGTVFCATVPNSTLITRRNGAILISGNSCTAHGLGSVMMKVRDLAGFAYIPLGPTSLYAQINGGRDQGSNPSDGITALERNGICTLADVPDTFIRWESISAAAKQTAQRFRITAAGVYTLSSFAEIVTADYLGWGVCLTVNVGNNFNPGTNGIVGYTPGMANHCVSGGESYKIIDGQPAYRFRNSWTTRWGVNGCGYITPRYIDQQPQMEAFAIKWTLSDPLDPDNPPQGV